MALCRHSGDVEEGGGVGENALTKLRFPFSALHPLAQPQHLADIVGVLGVEIQRVLFRDGRHEPLSPRQGVF